MENVVERDIRPTGEVIVDTVPQQANFYAEPTSNRPVESTEIFFKDFVGTLSCTPGDARGMLLLAFDLDFNHGPNLTSRKLNYAYIKYKELKITGKRTDIVFGRSGSIGIVYTTNPWYQVSDTDPAANAAVIASDPTYRILTISDHLEIDIMRNIKNMVKANEWFHANVGAGMPYDYYTAGRVFVFVESPPQLLPYEMPVYCAGTVQVKDFIPTALSSLTRVKQRVVIKSGAVRRLMWDPAVSEYILHLALYSEDDDLPLGSGLFLPDEPMNDLVPVIDTPADGDEEDDAPTEMHHMYDSPTKYYASGTTGSVEFRCSVSKLTNFLEPKIPTGQDIIPADIPGWAVFQSQLPSTRIVGGIHIDDIPVGKPHQSLASFRRIAGLQRVANLARTARGLEPIVTTRPAGDPDLLSLARNRIIA
nr:Hypothetical protein CDS [Astacus astacus]